MSFCGIHLRSRREAQLTDNHDLVARLQAAGNDGVFTLGAYFSGVACGSVHGWLWIATALAGNAVGVRLRPVFGLAR